jgi:long-chain fatty acid transport protein
MVSNPAGITQIDGKRLDLGFAFEVPYESLSNKYNDVKNNYKHFYPIPEIGYVQKFSRFSIGLGLYGLGGAGVDLMLKSPFFEEIKEARSKIGIAKFTPTVSYEVSPNLSMGFSLNIHYGTMDLRTPLGPAYIKIKNLSGVGPGFAYGILYKPNKKISFGFAYTSRSFYGDWQTDKGYLELSGLLSNKDGGGFRGNYKVKLIDFQMPQRVGFGIAIRPTDRLLIGFDADWVDWSNSLKKTKLKLYDGDGPDKVMNLSLKYRDVYIFGIGGEYKVTERFTIRAGYEYVSDLVPDEANFHMFQLFSYVHHITFGMGYNFGPFEINFGFYRGFPQEEYTNKTDLPAPELNNTLYGHREYYYNIMLSFLL